MGWNDHKTTVGGNWGDSPSRAEGIPSNKYVWMAWKNSRYLF
jgi:hypothetical protein